MSNIRVVGGQWGDEGKAKVITHIIPSYGINSTYREKGGRNAGHTAHINGKKYALHCLPTGVLFPGVYNGILADVVFDPVFQAEEIRNIRGMGIDITPDNLGISKRCHITPPYAYEMERVNEGYRGDKKIGTTMKAVGPTYELKAGREGIRFGEFLDEDLFYGLLEEQAEKLRKLRGIRVPVDEWSKWIENSHEAREYLAGFAADDIDLKKRRMHGNNLFEGAQGTMLGRDHGDYPFVTVSEPVSRTDNFDVILGVFKPYSTRVGAGPHMARMPPMQEDITRKRGKEYGTTTGRPRNCGWFDLLQAEYSIIMGGMDMIAMVKMDVPQFEEIKVCTGYKYKGLRLSSYPENRRVMEQAEPIFETWKGWNGGEMANAVCFEDMPEGAREFIDKAEQRLGKSVALISKDPSPSVIERYRLL